METFEEVLTALVGFAVLTTVLEYLLPSGPVKRWLQYLFSLLTISLLFAPVIRLLRMLGD